MCVLSLRYLAFYACVGRTLIIAPTKAQEHAYDFLFAVQENLLQNLKAGTVIADACEATRTFAKAKDPELASKLSQVTVTRMLDAPFVVCCIASFIIIWPSS